VVPFSIVKWSPFRLSRFRQGVQSGPLFDCQVGPFSLDKIKETTGVTVEQFMSLLAELRQALPNASLDPDVAQAAEADLQVAESQAQKAKPNAALILLKLKGVAELVATADSVLGIASRVQPLAQQVLELAGQLFR